MRQIGAVDAAKENQDTHEEIDTNRQMIICKRKDKNSGNY